MGRDRLCVFFCRMRCCEMPSNDVVNCVCRYDRGIPCHVCLVSGVSRVIGDSPVCRSLMLLLCGYSSRSESAEDRLSVASIYGIYIV